jgi:PAS domain S-box-containing protein
VSVQDEEEEALLRSVALQNANTILFARQRAEEDLLRAKEALRESQERLQAALRAARTGTFRWDVRTNALEWDENLDGLFGLAPGETVRSLEQFLAAIHADDRPGVADLCERCAREGSDLDLEFRALWPDGSPRWIDCNGKTFFDAEGKPQYVTGACVDITRRKRTDEKLREETRMLELLNDTGTAIAAELDLQRLVQAVTDSATALSGARFGAFFYNVVSDQGEAYLLYTLSGAPREAFERFGLPRNTPVFDPTFRGHGVIRSADITQDPRYGAMAPHHGMPKGHLPVRSYLAVPVKSRSGEVIGGLFFGHPDPDVFTERAERLIAGVAAQAGIAIDNARLYEAAQKAAEERKALLESERSARAAAERMSEMKDDFLATLSHELRTPLNAIVGWAHVLRSGPKNEADLLRGLDSIERNALVQAQLIEDLLDMSRITSGKMRLDVQPIHPASFIEAAVETLKPAADAKGIRLESFLDPAAGPISGDPGRLQQVIWNLLSNAIKFTPKGGRVQVLLERVNSHIEVSVADTGVGIKPELIEHLFERFRQADASTTRKFSGLGLGLSIVKHLTELHGGTVRITSPGEGLGTTVVVHLPLLVVHRAADSAERLHPRAAQAPQVSFTATDLSGLKVLVVDDQADARDLIKRVLEDCHAEVLTAGSVDEALPLVESERPQVLVSDIGMPDADGYELLRRVRTLGAGRGGKVPAIALTAFARSEDRTRALRAGFLVHVSKPVDPSELVATVASVAGRVEEPP